MIKKSVLLILILQFLCLNLFCQRGKILGSIIDKDSVVLKEIPIKLDGSAESIPYDKDGEFLIKYLHRDLYNLIINDAFLFSERHQNPLYYPLVIKNIPISKEKPIVNLNSIILSKIYSIKDATELPYIDFNSNRYWYSLINSQYEELSQYLVVDLNQPNVKGEYQSIPRISAIDRESKHRFVGGLEELLITMANSLEYPSEAVEKGIVGTSLSSCIIDTEGQVKDVKIINSICPSIDAIVEANILRTNGYWYEDDNNQNDTIYFQITFTFNEKTFNIPDITCSNLVNIHISARGITSPLEQSLSEANIVNDLSSSLKEKNYQEAIILLDEAIRRNPYSAELYQMRIMVNTKLGMKNKVIEDVNKVTNFMNGKSLRELL